MKIDTGGNFLPLQFNNMHADIEDLVTSRLIASGDLGPYTLPAKAYTQVDLPLLFNYTAANNTDPTWSTVWNACRNKNQYAGGIRPGEYGLSIVSRYIDPCHAGIGLSITVFMNIAGLISSYAASVTIPNAPCPFELPSTA